MAPRGVLIDFVGTLTRPIPEAMASFGATINVAPERLRDAVLSHYHGPLVADLECGRLSAADFEPQLVAGLTDDDGQPVPADGFLIGMYEHFTPDPDMLAVTRELQAAGVRTGLLSNAWGFEAYDLVRDAFDVTVISTEVGVRKPEPEIFAHAIAAMDLPAGEIVFVDDFDFNIEAGERAGLRGLHHTSPADTVARLRETFAL